MKKILKIGNVGMFLVGLLLMTYFALTGSYVDEDGFLIEEFWAWAIGVWMVIFSLAGFLVWGLFKIFRRNNT